MTVASKTHSHLDDASKDREVGGAALNESRFLPQKKSYQTWQFSTVFSRMRHECSEWTLLREQLVRDRDYLQLSTTIGN